MNGDDWSNEEIIRLWFGLADDLDEAPNTMFGRSLWTVFSNNWRVVDRWGMVVETGSWRYCGGLIASICGGDYMDYYMGYLGVYKPLVKRIRAWLHENGFIIIDWDTWEDGVLAGTYKVPSHRADYYERMKRGEVRRQRDTP